jgi:ParB-like chromosome segregation protein Spo0J
MGKTPEPDLASVKDAITEAIAGAPEPLQVIEGLRALLHRLSPLRGQPVDHVRWVAVEKVEPNDYNPNSVAGREMDLLHASIDHDGYTQPIVTVYDEARDRYVIVDGFHRYFTAKNSADIRARLGGLVPVVVIDKPINDRMASTVRHNRARGKHSVQGMSQMVFQMLDGGGSDHEICNELGMEAEELMRLKHITGFSKLFENAEYKRAWMTKRQIMIRKAHRDREGSTDG